MNSLAEKFKWIGTCLLLVGVTLNILNNPELQKYVYPWNLVINNLGTGSLFVSALIQRDKPYIVLNGVLAVGYLLGATNAFYPLSDILEDMIKVGESVEVHGRAFLQAYDTPL